MRPKLKILVVDDSSIFRQAIEKVLREDPNVNVLGSASDGLKAMDFIKSAPELPDLVTLDLEMPGMGGLDTLKAIQDFNRATGTRIGVLIVSSYTHHGAEVTIEALESGAFDFVLKPNGDSPDQSTSMLRTSLMVKVRYFAILKNQAEAGRKSPPGFKITKATPAASVSPKSDVKSVIIGVSTGGPQCLSEFLPPLCEAVELPILIVQHMPKMFTETLANSLDLRCKHDVKEAAEGDEVANKKVLIAPGGRHMAFKKKDNGSVFVALNDQPPENGCKPSVDVMFRSAGEVFSGNVVSIILTGMGSDGAASVPVLKKMGAYVIAQNEASSVVWGMPKSAVETGGVDEVLPLMSIPEAVKREVERRKG